MSAEYWMLVIFGGVVALVLGFFAGRRSAPAQQRLEVLEKERDEARAEAERVQAEVARHFEHSARMFGRLADDYRSFFEHFARTAQNLGLSEGRARELLQRADPRLVADQTGNAPGGDGEPGESGAVPDNDGGKPATAQTATAGNVTPDTDEPGAAGTSGRREPG